MQLLTNQINNELAMPTQTAYLVFLSFSLFDFQFWLIVAYIIIKYLFYNGKAVL